MLSTATRPKIKPARKVRLIVERPDGSIDARITIGQTVHDYTFRPVKRGWSVDKFDPATGKLLAVYTLNWVTNRCTCPSAQHSGDRPCKHVAALRAIMSRLTKGAEA